MTIITAVPSPRELGLIEESMGLTIDHHRAMNAWGLYFAQNMLLGIQEGTFNSRTGGRIFMVPPSMRESFHNPLRNCPFDPKDDLAVITELLKDRGWQVDRVQENRGEIPFNWPDRSRVFGYDLFLSRISNERDIAA